MSDIDARNRETSQREVEAFRSRSAGEHGTDIVAGWYFAYWHTPDKATVEANTIAGIRTPRTITTWMGDLLATVTWEGAPYQCPAFGGWPTTRVNFRAKGIDGREWCGTYYKSSGDYVRMRPMGGSR